MAYVKTLTLRFAPEVHAKLVKLKERSDAKSWEDFILKLAEVKE